MIKYLTTIAALAVGIVNGERPLWIVDSQEDINITSRAFELGVRHYTIANHRLDGDDIKHTIVPFFEALHHAASASDNPGGAIYLTFRIHPKDYGYATTFVTLHEMLLNLEQVLAHYPLKIMIEAIELVTPHCEIGNELDAGVEKFKGGHAPTDGWPKSEDRCGKCSIIIQYVLLV